MRPKTSFKCAFILFPLLMSLVAHADSNTIVKVWALVFYLSSPQAGGPAVIDNIVSREECIRVASQIKAASSPSPFDSHAPVAQCIEVTKTIPR